MIAKSFERIHRSNLVGMGIIPLCFKAGQDAESLGLTGKEKFDIELPKDIKPGMDVTVKTDTGKEFPTTLRFDTQVSLPKVPLVVLRTTLNTLWAYGFDILVTTFCWLFLKTLALGIPSVSFPASVALLDCSGC